MPMRGTSIFSKRPKAEGGESIKRSFATSTTHLPRASTQISDGVEAKPTWPKTQVEKMEERLLAYLDAAQEPPTQKEIRAGIKGASVTKRAALTRLVKSGQVRQLGRGTKSDPRRYERVLSDCLQPVTGPVSGPESSEPAPIPVKPVTLQLASRPGPPEREEPQRSLFTVDVSVRPDGQWKVTSGTRPLKEIAMKRKIGWTQR